MTRILHLSDPHFGALDAAAESAFLEHAAGLSPDLTVLSGDLTMRARRGELRDARRFVDALPEPRLVIPGNHDIPAFNQPLDRFLAPFRRYRSAFGPDLQPVVRLPGIHAVSANSSIAYGWSLDWSTGHLDKGDLAHIARNLAGAPDDAFRILVLHHPLLAPPGYRRAVVRPLDKLLELTSHHRVDFILCGHFHQSHTAVVGSGWRAMLSQAPTVCSTRLQGEPPGFHMITLDGPHAEIELRAFDGACFRGVRRATFRRDAQGWRESHGTEEF